MKRVQKKSIRPDSRLVLGAISVEDARRFVLDCANLPWRIDTPKDRPRFEDWLKRWKNMFTYRKEDDQGHWITLQIPNDWLEQFVPVVSATIRGIWKETDVRQRDWYFYR